MDFGILQPTCAIAQYVDSSIDTDYVAETARTRENPRYLPGVTMPRELIIITASRISQTGRIPSAAN